MAIVFQRDSRSGITYAYEATYVWNKEIKQSRSVRKLIGRVDPTTGEIVPTDQRMKHPRKETKTKPRKSDTPSVEHTKRSFYGATYLLDEIGKQLGITEDLKKSFPNTYEQILSVAYYMILEDPSPLSRFEKWGTLHKHPYGNDIPSQRSSELFASITEEAKNQFLSLQGKRKEEMEYWAYDTTSVSSYSETLRQVQYGKNKEDDKLGQLNLALVFGEKTKLPFYYRKLAGNIPDVKTVKNLLADFSALGFKKSKLVMDRGFYSQENINALYQQHLKFLIATKTSLSFVRKALDSVYDDFRTFENFDDNHEIYSTTITSEWDYTQQRRYKGDTLKEKRRMYIHLYYNIDKACEDQKNFDKKLMQLRRELLSGNRNPENEKQYQKYFIEKATPIRGLQLSVREDVVLQAKRYYGFFALLSNEKMDACTALQLYRNKDLVEKAFGNVKERLNMRRTLVSSEQSLDGKLFVSFVALIYLSYISKQMQDKNLFKEYTLQGLLDKLDVIECFESPGHKLRLGEVLEKQKDIFLRLGVKAL